MPPEAIYKIMFINQSQVYELYARNIYQSDLYGFIEVEHYVFGERSQIVLDPSEERLKSEFSGVKRSYIPVHSILRIDEVEREGAARIKDAKSGGKVTSLPFPGHKPGMGVPGSDPGEGG